MSPQNYSVVQVAKIGKICVTLHGKIKFLEEKVNLPLFIARRTAVPSEENRPSVMVRFATIAVALSLAVMLLSMAVIMGFKEEVSRRIVGFSSDVELSDIRSCGPEQLVSFRADSTLLAWLREDPRIARLSTYAAKAGVLKSPEGMQGVLLKGVDKDFDTRFFEQLITEGQMPSLGEEVRKKELLLSESVARKLRLKVGDKVEILFLEAEGSARRDRFKIAGLYHSGMEEADERYLLTDMRNVQRLIGDNEAVSGIEITLRNTEEAEEAADALNRELLYGEWEGVENLLFRSVQERYPAMFDWLRTHDVNAAVILGIMLLVALFNMISALLILVLERTRMIGLLKALGMTNRQLQKIFLYRAAFITLKGVAWGNLTALLLCLAQKWGHIVKLDASGYLLSEVPIALGWGWWLAVNLGAVAVILLLLTLPTSIVSRIRPEQTIRYE